MKSFVFFVTFFVCFTVQSTIRLETNFGEMDEFDTPQLMQWYPNSINNDADYRAFNSDCYYCGLSLSDDYHYFGVKFALTDSFIWMDGGFYDNFYKFDDSLDGDFYINVFTGGEKFEVKVVDTGSNWFFGSFYNSVPTKERIRDVRFSLTSVDEARGEYGTFVFDSNRTNFFIGKQPLAFVPEPASLVIFLLVFVGVLKRRFLKFKDKFFEIYGLSARKNTSQYVCLG